MGIGGFQLIQSSLAAAGIGLEQGLLKIQGGALQALRHDETLRFRKTFATREQPRQEIIGLGENDHLVVLRHHPEPSLRFDAVIDWENLWQAYRLAARGKRRKDSAARFEHQVADRLITLQRELRERTYRPGAYRHFTLHEPKRRKISAAPFRDRVVHHALCNLIEPVFERRFIDDSYANRRGKGTHRALDRLQQFARGFRYVLRADIVQHFPSLDHAVLRDKLFRVVQDDGLRWLIDTILASGDGVLRDEYTQVYFPGDDLFAACRPRGLPIGNLSSQFWSNVYLNDFDWFVTRELRCRAYLRYVDDFALFSDSKRELAACKRLIIERLAADRLRLHEAETQVLPTRCGIPWLGFVIHPTHRLLKRRNAIRFTRHFSRLLDLYHAGAISFAELDASVQGWIEHVRYADTWGLREHLFSTHRLYPAARTKTA